MTRFIHAPKLISLSHKNSQKSSGQFMYLSHGHVKSNSTARCVLHGWLVPSCKQHTCTMVSRLSTEVKAVANVSRPCNVRK